MKPTDRLALVPAEVSAVAIVHDREDAAADRDARHARVSGVVPRFAIDTDLFGLLNVKAARPIRRV